MQAMVKTGRYKHWTGLLEWTTGLAYFGFSFHFLHSLVQGGVILLKAFSQYFVLNFKLMLTNANVSSIKGD